jgi:hypothetical protein
MCDHPVALAPWRHASCVSWVAKLNWFVRSDEVSMS